MLDAMVKLAKIFCYGSIGAGALATTAMSMDYMQIMLKSKEETNEETETDKE